MCGWWSFTAECEIIHMLHVNITISANFEDFLLSVISQNIEFRDF